VAARFVSHCTWIAGQAHYKRPVTTTHSSPLARLAAAFPAIHTRYPTHFLHKATIRYMKRPITVTTC
jgi:hypothetical protein